MVDVAKLDLRRLDRAVKKVPRELAKEMKSTLRKSLRRIEGRLVRERLSGNPLKRRTGQLARGWKVIVLGESLDLTGVLFTNVPYARIHERGGVIRPKRGAWLWIPLGPLLTPAGVFRGWDRLPPRDQWFFRRSKRNPRNLVLFARRGARGSIRPWAVLAKEVRIKPQMGLAELVRRDRPNRVRELNDGVRRALKIGAR